MRRVSAINRVQYTRTIISQEAALLAAAEEDLKVGPRRLLASQTLMIVL